MGMECIQATCHHKCQSIPTSAAGHDATVSEQSEMQS